MKIFFIAISVLFMVATLVSADSMEYKIDYNFSDYDEKCDAHWDLNENGLKVKANRLAEQYRAKALYPLFKLKSGESRIYVLRAKIGFWIKEIKDFADPIEVWLSDIKPDDTEYKNLSIGSFNLGENFNFVNFIVPKTTQEKWEGDVYEYFKKPEQENQHSGAGKQFAFNEVRVKVTVESYEKYSYVVSDCFDANSKTDHGISLKSAELMDYKIINISDEHKKYYNPNKGDAITE